MATVRKLSSPRMTQSGVQTWEPDGRSVLSGRPIGGGPAAPDSGAHGTIQTRLCLLPGNHLPARGSLCQVAVEPGIVPKIGADRRYRIPDIGATRAPPAPGQMLPDPAPPIAILSPSNETGTLPNVMIYALSPGAAEILAIHGTRIGAGLPRQTSDGARPREPVTLGPDAALIVEPTGFSVPMKDVYRAACLAAP